MIGCRKTAKSSLIACRQGGSYMEIGDNNMSTEISSFSITKKEIIAAI